VAAWGAAFLLSLPRAYRLFGFLAWSAILLALKDGRPHAVLWVPVCSPAADASSAARHLVHDLLAEGRRIPLNLQNARVVVALAAGCATLTFLGVYGALRPVFGPPGQAAVSTERGRLEAENPQGAGVARGGGPAPPPR